MVEPHHTMKTVTTAAAAATHSEEELDHQFPILMHPISNYQQLHLPLVFPLAEVVSLNTSGARALKSRQQLRDAKDDAPATWDSKVDKFDNRRALVLEKTTERWKDSGRRGPISFAL